MRNMLLLHPNNHKLKKIITSQSTAILYDGPQLSRQNLRDYFDFPVTVVGRRGFATRDFVSTSRSIKRRFLSCTSPLFQSESQCEVFHIHVNKTNFRLRTRGERQLGNRLFLIDLFKSTEKLFFATSRCKPPFCLHEASCVHYNEAVALPIMRRITTESSNSHYKESCKTRIWGSKLRKPVRYRRL